MSPERLISTAAKEGILAIVYVKTDINTTDLTSQVRLRHIATNSESDGELRCSDALRMR